MKKRFVIMLLVIATVSGLLILSCSMNSYIGSGSMSPGGLTVGGAQDFSYVRMQIENGYMPTYESFLIEGLYSEYNLPVEGEPAVNEVEIRGAQGIVTSIDSRNTDAFVQLGLDTSIDIANYERPTLNICLIIDISGSMSGTGISIARTAARAVIDELGPDDIISVVLFDHASYLWVEACKASDREWLKSRIDAIHIGGSTNIEAGLRTGHQEVVKNSTSGRANRIFLFTDANPNVSTTDPDSFYSLIDGYSNENIYVTTLGVCLHFNDRFVDTISQVKGANYYFLDTTEKAATMFSDELDFMVSPIAFDVHIVLEAVGNYDLREVYGVRDYTLSDNIVEMNIPTLFLSSRGGAILFRLTPKSMAVNSEIQYVGRGEVSYTDRDGNPAGNEIFINLHNYNYVEGEGIPHFSQAGVRTTYILTMMFNMMISGSMMYYTYGYVDESIVERLADVKQFMWDNSADFTDSELAEREIAFIDKYLQVAGQ